METNEQMVLKAIQDLIMHREKDDTTLQTH